ncbi:YaaA family protein [Antricoccus suffuscus]|uniref:YaaA family protein n=1 Tax=Antricoccus suffuscus TaxID=1629062 RepID=UPI0014768028|nr:peroxide stress protein YaaA [Antricoccus suffuscus]
MLILLPPSEGKTQASTGKPVDVSSLSFPELTSARHEVAKSLIEVSGGADALKVLKVPAGLGELVAANADLLDAPAAPAWKVYTGVLFDAFGYADLDPAAKRRAARQVVVSSALWGAVRLTDRIPAYRLSMSVSLPRLGGLARFWKPMLDEPMTDAAARGLIIDCRSSTYAASWRPSGTLTKRYVPVRVFREQAGVRTVVSHMAKHSRGLIARALTQQAAAPKSVDELVVLLNAHFDQHAVYTATGEKVDLYVEAAQDDLGLDVITT